ncbi:MAG: chorismate synthase [Defluviitaleaceae bacterium]|nr:chorismate synthase [Defluviitaleaceae bacterium]
MSGSSFGKLFKITTWGESHGLAVGVCIDGCPAGLSLYVEDIQKHLDRRKPGSGEFSTVRKEDDKVKILSGVFEDKTIGSPISVIIENEGANSNDYNNLKDIYRPGHADYTYEAKYGIRDYRGGGRASGRETAARVAAGAVALKLLSLWGIEVNAFAIEMAGAPVDKSAESLKAIKEQGDSAGGIIECVVKGVPAGIGEPVFDKLDAVLAQAVFSIGGVKGLEFGSGFSSANMLGSVCNDSFYYDETVKKRTNNSGGVLGGISDGSDIVFRAAIKPVPSIEIEQETINNKNESVKISVEGRHDVTAVPRIIPVIEAMAAIVIVDYMLQNLGAKLDYLLIDNMKGQKK